MSPSYIKIIDCLQGSEQWHTARLGKATTSNFHKVLAKGSGSTRFQYLAAVATERITGKRTPGIETPDMKRGIELEAQARAMYEVIANLTVQQVGFIQFNNDIGCSPDGLIDEDGTLEIKCPKLETHKKYIADGKLPSIYVPQVQGTLWVTGRKWCDFVSYCPEHEETPYWYRRIHRDEAKIAEIEVEVRAFVADIEKLMNNLERKDEMAKEQVTFRLKTQYPPEQGNYGGMQQGIYITTDRGEFKCYNSGPTWFTDAQKNQQITVTGEWKQTKGGKNPGSWYLQCEYGQAAAPQGPASPAPPLGPPLGPPAQAPPAAPAQGPATQQTPPPPQSPPVQQSGGSDKKVHGQCFTLLTAALLESGAIPTELVKDVPQLTALADIATACMKSYEYRSAGDGGSPAMGTDDDGLPYPL